ncbi:hypothetical protein [Candidatus Clostridium radicumherbarum]|uniref:Uncharacterized protein n=1 Tax=Candidatus Clostridium radicumherbarum TaxID=3381662 RepID=A0ABW8TXE3_9CLOT
MINEKLGHGFISGINNLTITKILKWQNRIDINWNAFIWYISDYATIVGFGENWFKVNIVSDKQLSFFYNKVVEYQPDICEHNYNVDTQNELWKDHKRGVERNFKILLKLIEQQNS